MSIANQIILRYRADGHVRFALPKSVLNMPGAERLDSALLTTEGVYRVDVYKQQGKLSIRYIEGVTSFKAVASALFDCLNKIERHQGSGMTMREEILGELGWLKAKYQEAKETVTALGIIARGANKAKSTLVGPDPEKFAIEFFTDLLVLYLIRLHWHLIMGHWIKNPWQYRSEWMATVYMVFLLVRSKKPKK